MLPGSDDAFVPREKLENYLLSPTHPIGGWKARFLLAVGFTKLNIKELESGLLAIARKGRVETVLESPYGTKYVVSALGNPPALPGDARSLTVPGVWEFGPENFFTTEAQSARSG